MTPFAAFRATTAALALLAAVPVAAQFVQQPTPTADALAVQMRQLAANPRDIYALIAAGELSTKLGDPAAALGFFGRAQAIDPSNSRVAAGKAGALVLLERPGEALLLYAQAERGGVAMTPYLAQRGLAYDLVGQPGYAQRDYRRALLIDRDDETVRRLALSLGISGRRDEAMTLLDPLLRRSDRAAWRARACILAIGGDVPGAQRIAATMMAGGSALTPFFSRLQWLSPADRAFAVHFGQLGSTPVRTNDARLAPVLAPLPVEPQALPSPVAVAASDRPVREPTRRETRRRRSSRDVAAVARAPTPTPAPTPILPDPPSRPTQLAMRDPLPTASGRGEALPSRAPVSSSIPMRETAPAPPAPAPSASLPPVSPSVATPSVVTPSVVSPSAALPSVVSPSPAQTTTSWIVTADTPSAAVGTGRLPAAPAIEIATLPPRDRPLATTPGPAPTLAPVPQTRGAAAATPTSQAPAPAPSVTAPAATPAALSPVPARDATAPEPRTPEVARRNTTMLASIIEAIAVPASELDVAPPRGARTEPQPVSPREAKKADAKKPDLKRPDPKKPESKKPDPARTDPARWWVQVAGGANAADLGKDWKRLTAKSAAAFRGKTAWTTPLRATNRLLAGPFKSQAEASAFVNQLAKDGTSAFAWQSDAGQKIERLSPK